METCDVLVVGGGPAGSACAWKLGQAGLDVLIVDRAVFPRQKVCGGWVTPEVFTDLAIDPDEYGKGRTLQPITGFRVGFVGGAHEIETRYGRPVSYGIRRYELDQYLLLRSNARVKQGTPIVSMERDGDRWIVNGEIRTSLLVGAGGQLCPVARRLNGPTNAAPLVVAQEAEFPVDESTVASITVEPTVPELYFSHDLKGYGWCFRKQGYVNVGLGRVDRQSLPRAMAEFAQFLEARGKLVVRSALAWRGHSYAVYGSPRQITDHGALLVGDAAGLAFPQSGEGIRPAVESGLLAAATIIEANGLYTKDRLAPYEGRLRARLGTGTFHRMLSRLASTPAGTAVVRRILQTPTSIRHLVLNRWFLHAHQPALPQTWNQPIEVTK